MLLYCGVEYIEHILKKTRLKWFGQVKRTVVTRDEGIWTEGFRVAMGLRDSL